MVLKNHLNCRKEKVYKCSQENGGKEDLRTVKKQSFGGGKGECPRGIVEGGEKNTTILSRIAVGRERKCTSLALNGSSEKGQLKIVTGGFCLDRFPWGLSHFVESP